MFDISGVLSWFASIFTYILDGILLIIQAALYLPFDALVTAVETIILSLDVSALAIGAMGGWGLIPSQLVYALNQIGIGQAFSIVITAMAIRFVLNLIPAAFTRI